MRFVATAVSLSLLALVSANAHAHAHSLDESATALAALEAKADIAPPKDRCFLYAELVSEMTELAGQQLNSGDSAHASQTLKLVQRYAEKLRQDVAENSKKLKNAELLMQRTSFRLKDILNAAAYEDRQPLEATLDKLNQVQVQLMMEVFKK